MDTKVDLLDEFDSILEIIGCNDPGNAVRAHKLREPLRKALAERDALRELCGDAVIVMDDTNSWLCRSMLGGTAHQLHLAEFIARAKAQLGETK